MLNGVLDWGLVPILWLQNGSPAWDRFFRLITALGDEQFFFFLVPVLFWLVHKKIAIRFSSLLFLSSMSNVWIKYATGIPRPFHYSSLVHNLGHPMLDPSFPSGHTAGTVLTWMFLAAHFDRRWIRLVGGALMVLIPLSRMYLGVHYPSDLLGGVLLALATLKLDAYLYEPLAGKISSLSFSSALSTLGVGTAVLQWVSPHVDLISHTITCSFFGFFLGLLLESRWVQFTVPVSGWHKLGLSLVGFPGVALLWSSGPWLRLYFEAPYARTLRYVSIAFWIAFFVPYGYCLIINRMKSIRAPHSKT